MQLYDKKSNEHGTVRVLREALPNGEHHYSIRVKVNVDPNQVFTNVKYDTLSRVDMSYAVDGLLEDLYRIARGERASHACFGQGVLA